MSLVVPLRDGWHSGIHTPCLSDTFPMHHASDITPQTSRLTRLWPQGATDFYFDRSNSMNAKKIVFVATIMMAMLAGTIFGWKAVTTIATASSWWLIQRLMDFCVGADSSSTTD